MRSHLVLHGTSIAYTETIRENGLMPPPGHGVGVRIRFELEDAMDDARAWAAYLLFREEGRIRPRGIIVATTVPEDWLSADASGTLRVRGLAPDKIEIRGPHDFTAEFLHPFKGPRPKFFECLEAWERLTDRRIAAPFKRRGARRS